MRCPECRVESEAASLFCRGCGHRLFAWLGDPFGNLEPTHSRAFRAARATPASVPLSTVLPAGKTDQVPFPWLKAGVAGLLLASVSHSPISALCALMGAAALTYVLWNLRSITWGTFIWFALAALVLPAATANWVPQTSSRPTATAIPSASGRSAATPAPRTAATPVRAVAVPPAAATAASLAKASDRVFGPKAGWIAHRTDQIVPSSGTEVKLRDFEARATFNNPSDHKIRGWDYGFFFRYTGPDEYYRLYVDSDSSWRLLVAKRSSNGVTHELVHQGTVTNLDTSPSGSNDLRLVVKDTDGVLFLNDEYVGILSLGELMKEGTVALGTGFMVASGGSTGYEGFTIWSLQ